METQDDKSWDSFTQALGHVIFALSSYESIHRVFNELQNQPQVFGDFLNMIALIVKDIETYQATRTELEESLQREAERRNEQLHILEEEMNAQITERVKVAKEEERKKMKNESIKLKDKYEKQINQLQEAVAKLKLVEQKLAESSPLERELDLTRERIFEITTEKSNLTTRLNEAESTIVLLRSQVTSLLFELQEKTITVDRGTDELSRSALERDHMAQQVQTLITDNRKLRDSHDNMQEVLQASVQRNSSGRYSRTTTPDASMTEEIHQRLSRYSSPNTSLRNSVLDHEAFAECDPAFNYVESDEEIDGDTSFKSSVDITLDSGIGVNQDDTDDGWSRPSSRLRRSSRRYQRNGKLSNERLPKIKPIDRMTQETLADFSEEDSEDSEEPVSPLPNNSIPKHHRNFPIHRTKRVISPDPEVLTDGPLFKVVLCGDVCVGKSSFMFRACNKSFKKHIRTTLGVDFQTKNVRINPSKTIAVQLWDTAGQERFRSMTSSYFRRAHGVILIYDVTNPESFLNVKEWMETITSTSDAGTPVMICGNKIDLRTKSYGRLNEVVYSKEGAQLAANYGSLFMETSAASGLNVDAALLTLARHLHKRTDCENGLIYDLKVQSETTDDSGCCISQKS